MLTCRHVTRASSASPTSFESARSVAAGLFEAAESAGQAVAALADAGFDTDQVGLVGPDTAGDVPAVLGSMGMPEGEVRFYAHGVADGQTLVAVEARGNADQARDILRQHGAIDVQSQGGELARPAGAGVSGGTGPRPMDLTGEWTDVRSRYAMLWGQHYGTSDATWEEVEPTYRYAWVAANEPAYRGRPWSEVEAGVRRDWESGGRAQLAWAEVAGPIRDVFEDVADEATTGAEGGQDRRVARQGGDQVGPARDVIAQP